MATSTTPVESISGLPPLAGVDNYKFLVRSSTGDSPYELALKVTGETEYKIGIANVDDSTIQQNAHTLIYNRKIKVREKLIADNTEVELSA